MQRCGASTARAFISAMSNPAYFNRPAPAELYFNGERLAAGQADFDLSGGRFEPAGAADLSDLPSDVVTLRVLETGDTYPVEGLRLCGDGSAHYAFRICAGT